MHFRFRQLAAVGLLAALVLPRQGAQAQPVLGRYRLQTRGLYVQIERRGWASEYWSGQVMQDYNTFDPVVGSTRAVEVELQLDTMRSMGINAIAFELRTADDIERPFPDCTMWPVLGFHWPQPTATELMNFQTFLDLVNRKGMRVLLRLVNVHMEEQPPTNSQTWLGAILAVAGNHPAVDLVLFEGNRLRVDTNGDSILDACGIPAEPPLWEGPTTVVAQYVRWAIGYALSLGIPARRLSAQAIIGDYRFQDNPLPGQLWSAIRVLRILFDDLGIPANQRTYAVSFYEHRKCLPPGDPLCIDVDPHTWAEQTLQNALATIGAGSGARLVAVEMGTAEPTTWPSRRALESLISLLERYAVEGGTFWRWTSFDNAEDTNPQLADPVKRRGIAFIYNSVQKEVVDMGGFHLTAIPNGSFETGTNPPTNWTITGADTAGVYNPATGVFFLRHANAAGPADLVFQYGPGGAGWTTLIGDWNGDGVRTPGLYDPATGRFYLRNANAPGPADLTFVYGPPAAGWIALAGDWDGDGIDTVGLYDPATSRFYLRNSNTPGPADATFVYGPAGANWTPLAGDWNGDGVDTPGLYNPASGFFFLRNTNTAGPADLTFAYGPGGAGFLPRVADWNGDGVITVGVYNPATGVFFLRNSNSAGPADLAFAYGPGGAGFVSLAGRWDGPGSRYFLAGEPGQPEVPSRGSYALRLITSPGAGDVIRATGASIAVSPNTAYTTVANLRFGWSGDPNPGGDPATRPQVFVVVRYFTVGGAPSAVRAQDVFRFFQEHSTQGFQTFPVQYTTPADANAVRIQVGAARIGLPTGITFDVDNLR